MTADRLRRRCISAAIAAYLIGDPQGYDFSWELPAQDGTVPKLKAQTR
jgi:hypothetical protein